MGVRYKITKVRNVETGEEVHLPIDVFAYSASSTFSGIYVRNLRLPSTFPYSWGVFQITLDRQDWKIPLITRLYKVSPLGTTGLQTTFREITPLKACELLHEYQRA